MPVGTPHGKKRHQNNANKNAKEYKRDCHAEPVQEAIPDNGKKIQDCHQQYYSHTDEIDNEKNNGSYGHACSISLLPRKN